MPSVSPQDPPSSLLSLSFCKQLRALSNIQMLAWASVDAVLHLDTGVQSKPMVAVPSSSVSQGSQIGRAHV